MLRETSHPKNNSRHRRGDSTVAQLMDAEVRTVAFKGQEASGTQDNCVLGTCCNPEPESATVTHVQPR